MQLLRSTELWIKEATHVQSTGAYWAHSRCSALCRGENEQNQTQPCLHVAAVRRVRKSLRWKVSYTPKDKTTHGERPEAIGPKKEFLTGLRRDKVLSWELKEQQQCTRQRGRGMWGEPSFKCRGPRLEGMEDSKEGKKARVAGEQRCGRVWTKPRLRSGSDPGVEWTGHRDAEDRLWGLVHRIKEFWSLTAVARHWSASINRPHNHICAW